MTDEDYVDISCTFKRATPKAIGVIIPDTKALRWIPRSLINGAFEIAIDKLSEDQEVVIPVKEWFAEKEELV